jgi:ribonuclease HI
MVGGNMSKPQVTIFTDGCAVPNPGKSGAGIVLLAKGNRKELAVPLGHGTNNTAELLAMIHALKALKCPCEVTIYTDSQITQKIAMGENQANSNIDLWLTYRTVAMEHEVKVVWIRKDSHDENKAAHRLANEAAAKSA